MTFTLMYKQRDVQFMLMVIVALSLILILTVVSGTQQKFDICQVLIKSVVVVLLFYVHGKHLRSCRDGQLT